MEWTETVSYTHLRAHETEADLVCRLLLEKKMISMLEKQSIINSIENLSEFPFIQKALSSNEISIHGLWNNIGTGELEMLNPKSMLFESL